MVCNEMKISLHTILFASKWKNLWIFAKDVKGFSANGLLISCYINENIIKYYDKMFYKGVLAV